MKKVNSNEIEELVWASPKGKFSAPGRNFGGARLGSESADAKARHPFAVEILRIAPGQTPYPYHSHAAQWEFYHVISGTGVVARRLR